MEDCFRYVLRFDVYPILFYTDMYCYTGEISLLSFIIINGFNEIGRCE